MSDVEEFIKKAMPIYQGMANEQRDKRCMELYLKALDEVKSWLSWVIHRDMEVNYYMSVYVKLNLPLGGIYLKVGHREDDHSYLHSPIGDMDYVTYLAIVRESDNPVILLYKYLSSQVSKLQEKPVQDVLGLQGYLEALSEVPKLFHLKAGDSNQRLT